jgi:hypothetical protein
MNYKEEEFERLWDGPNKTKSDQFRNLMRSRLELRGFPFSKTNAKELYLGRLGPRDMSENVLPPRFRERQEDLRGSTASRGGQGRRARRR